MLIIKPYGRSKTQPKSEHPASRQRLLLSKNSNSVNSIATLQHDIDFVIAHWISVIDKIIKKPQRIKPQLSKTQYEAREALGKAAWQYIERNFQNVLTDEQHQHWNWKLHPYPRTPCPDKETDQIKGRFGIPPNQ